MDRKLLVYIACSLDGYITGPAGDLDFLKAVEAPGEDYGYAAFMSEVDTLIMGRKTYDTVMKLTTEWPYGDRQVWVCSRQGTRTEGKLSITDEDPVQLVRRLKSLPGKHIFCDGGAEIIQRLLANHCVDEITISWIPVLLGGGIRLFSATYPIQDLQLLTARSYASGLVQTRYRVSRADP